MPVSRKLHYCGSSYSPGYTSDFLGIPIDLGYQLRDFSVSVLTWKMGLRIREILIAIPNNRTKFSLHFRFLQALQGEHSFPLPDMILKVENIVYNELLIRGYNVDVGIVEAYAKMMKEKQLESSLKLILWSIRGVRDIIFRWLMI